MLDRDGDGILDGGDECPDEAENFDGYKDVDGCPEDADPDHDGVIGDADECPTVPEDMDNFQDPDGCPDTDNDKDGLLDTVDHCPNQAGPPENGGCPDQDRDGDTVVDRLDNCPDVPGSVSNHGCKKKQLVEITATHLLITGSVTFGSNKTRIQKRSNRLLNNVADVLLVHPEITAVVIEGHTDDRGSEDSNQTLSQGRAEAVVAYLVKRKIAADRLQAKGYGEGRPIADNTKAAGRATNRRVDFAITTNFGPGASASTPAAALQAPSATTATPAIAPPTPAEERARRKEERRQAREAKRAERLEKKRQADGARAEKKRLSDEKRAEKKRLSDEKRAKRND
jgi:outer membrane protein OmpA-like peptidoglycan-associated protein